MANSMDIRKHRFVPVVSTTSKVFVDKRRKSKTRRNLKKQLKTEIEKIGNNVAD
jgi:hypothetical protein